MSYAGHVSSNAINSATTTSCPDLTFMCVSVHLACIIYVVGVGVSKIQVIFHLSVVYEVNTLIFITQNTNVMHLILFIR